MNTENTAIPLISEHDTWISLDPVIGCPADCAYCFVAKYGQTATRPIQRITEEEAVAVLERYLAEESPLNCAVARRALRLVCLGNYTDMFLTRENREYVTRYTMLHHRRFPDIPLVFVTKGVLDAAIIDSLDTIGHKCLVFLSQSFFRCATSASSSVERGVALPEQSVRSWTLLARSDNLKPLHFWRPLTWLNIPDAETARRQLTLVRDSGALASVAVGLKQGEFLAARFASPTHPLHSTLPAVDEPNGPVGELFPVRLQQLVLREAESLRHPTFLNTSCAVSMVLERPDFLQTWRAPLREARCLPSHCLVSQRARCNASGAPSVPSAHELKQIAQYLLVPEDVVRWNDISQQIDVPLQLSQSTQCRLTHVTGHRIAALALRTSREWVGTLIGVGHSMGQIGIPVELPLGPGDKPMRLQIERMRNITGMVSPIAEADDLRPTLFSRYSHVRRVATLGLAIATRIQEAGGSVCIDSVRRLAWLHDLNRWPFAHNGERGHFDQIDDLSKFFEAESIAVSVGELADLCGIHRRDAHSLTLEGLAVLTADRAVGMVEDVLFAIVVLGLAPERVPHEVSDRLGIPVDNAAFRERLLKTRQWLIRDRDVERFVDRFEPIVTGHALQFVSRHVVEWRSLCIASSFSLDVAHIRNEYLMPFLFPLVNEVIGRGRFQRERIVEPLIAAWQPDHARKLTRLNDREAADWAIRAGSMKSHEMNMVMADLDYLDRERPDLSFHAM